MASNNLLNEFYFYYTSYLHLLDKRCANIYKNLRKKKLPDWTAFFSLIQDFLYHFSILSSSTFTVCLILKSAMTIANPIAASAAATDITKNTKICPEASPKFAAKPTKVRLTEFSINSIDMKMIIALRRVMTPIVPIEKMIPDKTR